MSTIVTGIKPTGTPHLGNHLGMIEPALRLAAEHDAYLFVADLHALNTTPDPEELRRRSRDVAATLLALGLDPRHAVLFGYPLLMASDILALGAERVPVGGDQRQHLEITRDIAGAFNATYGATFVLPEAVVDDRVELVPGTDGRKMSKSYGNTIPILGAPEEVERAVMRVVTDTRPVDEPKDPEEDLVFALFRLVAERSDVDELAERYRAGGLRYVDAKRELATVLIDGFTDARTRYRELQADPSTLESTLTSGAERASAVASHNLDVAREAVGLGRAPRRRRGAA